MIWVEVLRTYYEPAVKRVLRTGEHVQLPTRKARWAVEHPNKYAKYYKPGGEDEKEVAPEPAPPEPTPEPAEPAETTGLSAEARENIEAVLSERHTKKDLLGLLDTYALGHAFSMDNLKDELTAAVEALLD